MSDDTSVREHMHAAIQESAGLDDDGLEGAVVIGWVCVVEWMHPSGNRWLSRLSGNAGADRAAADWQMQGYLHNALNDWPDDVEDQPDDPFRTFGDS